MVLTFLTFTNILVKLQDQSGEMKNKDLITILSLHDPEAEVFLEYDTMCCVYDNFTIAAVSCHQEYEDGIYLMCETADTARFLFNEKTDGKYEGHKLFMWHEG